MLCPKFPKRRYSYIPAHVWDRRDLFTLNLTRSHIMITNFTMFIMNLTSQITKSLILILTTYYWIQKSIILFYYKQCYLLNQSYNLYLCNKNKCFYNSNKAVCILSTSSNVLYSQKTVHLTLKLMRLSEYTNILNYF